MTNMADGIMNRAANCSTASSNGPTEDQRLATLRSDKAPRPNDNDSYSSKVISFVPHSARDNK